jgi:hypothetical protein
MPFRTLIILTLFLTLLVSAAGSASTPVRQEMPACGMNVCMNGCCGDMPCCAQSTQDTPVPERAPALQRSGFEFAANGLPTSFVLHALPVAERRFVIRDEAQAAHTLPRLAVSCISLI